MLNYTVYYGSDTESNEPDQAESLEEAIALAHQSILSVIGGKPFARIEDADGTTLKAYRYDEYGDMAGQVYEVNA
jgi:hypothetical protein